MGILTKLGQSVYDFLGKKIDRAEIKTVTSGLGASLAFREMATYIAISYVANTIAKCRFNVYENGKQTDNLLSYVLNVNPNPNYSANRFKNKLIWQMYETDGALIVPKGDRSIYIADDFNIDKSPGLGNWIFYGAKIDDYTDLKKYRQDKVFFVQQDNADVKSLINAMYGIYTELILSAIQRFKSNNGKKYKLIIGNYKAGDEEFNDTYQKIVEQQIKPFLENPTAVYPQFEGYDLQEMEKTSSNSTASNAANNIVNLRKDAFESVAQAFKIPASLLTGNITNIQDVTKVFVTFCIEPIADAIGNELTRKCYNFDEWKRGCFIKVDTSKINHYDLFDVAEKVDKLISNGVTSIDEIRAVLDMPLLNTDFGQCHFITKNYETAENALKEGDEPE